MSSLSLFQGNAKICYVQVSFLRKVQKSNDHFFLLLRGIIPPVADQPFSGDIIMLSPRTSLTISQESVAPMLRSALANSVASSSAKLPITFGIWASCSWFYSGRDYSGCQSLYCDAECSKASISAYLLISSASSIACFERLVGRVFPNDETMPFPRFFLEFPPLRVGIPNNAS